MREHFIGLKKAGRKLVTLTAADYPTARLLDEAGLDFILVGDSLGMVELGYPDTTEVTLDDMLHHVRAVRRGVKKTPLAADLPYKTYETADDALETARQLVKAGAEAVKLEGGRTQLAKAHAIVAAGIPLIGHIGMLPQSVRLEGGYKRKGKTPEHERILLNDAQALDAAGVCAIVIECVEAPVAARISRGVQCPTVGIGSGPDCDGQILVTHDVIGAFPWFTPPFTKPRGDVAGEIQRAVAAYVAEVRVASKIAT
ncbi:MAG: 3-methyl-2-oxobutanoate hydroxymethyltransferase [Verrucomicrobiales bacterium]